MRVGIVGCGSIAQVHAEAISKMETAQLVAVMDIIKSRAEDLADIFGGEVCDTFEELLGSDIDVLHICTPHVQHTPMAKAAAEKGIAVFTEKPPVITFEQWEEFQKIAESIPLGICFQNRYNKSVCHIKQFLSEGKGGSFIGAKAFLTWKREEAYYTESSWRGSLETEGGGALINQAIHTLDLLVYFLGRPKKVEAAMQNFHLKDYIEVEDTLNARIDYNGAPVLFYATTGYSVDSPVFIEMLFENVTVQLRENHVDFIWKNGRIEKFVFETVKHGGKAYWGSGHENCINDYYHKLEMGEAPPIGVPEIENTIELLLSTYLSAREGKEVRLD